MVEYQDNVQTTDPDPPNKHHLKPVIQELIRTEFCPSTLRLLVDRILITRLPSGKRQRKEAYRLWLSDGEKAIQAVLKADIHPFITSHDIREGTYVEITKYGLARSRRLKGDGTVAHLLVSDLRAFAKEERPEYEAFAYEQGIVEAYLSPTSSTENHDSLITEFDELHRAKTIAHKVFNNYYASEDDIPEEDDEVDLVSWYGEHASSRNAVKGSKPYDNTRSPSKKRKSSSLSDPLRQIDCNLSSSPTKRARARDVQYPTDKNPVNGLETKQQEAPSASAVSNSLQKILRPIRVTPLADLTGSKASRNKVRDVCVVITSVDANIKRKGTDDIRQFRIMDLSTRKRVLFSTFVDPKQFMPPLGTIALLRSVTTHQWDGGSLNAYKRDCLGREWFFPNPIAILGCDVSALQALWEEVRLEDSVDSC